MEDKESQAHSLVIKYMWRSTAIGLIPAPIVDFTTITAVQLPMLSKLSKIYGVPFHEHRAKPLVSVLLSSIPVPARTLKAVPVVGAVLGTLTPPVFVGAATYAVGTVFMQHFESGGTLLDFDPVKVRESFKQEFEEGRRSITEKQEEKTRET